MMRINKCFLLLPLLFVVGCSGSSSSTPSAVINDNTSVITCYDVQLINAGNSQTKNICTTKENGGYNGLGVARFLKFTVNSLATVSIKVTRTSGLDPADPDIYLFKNGTVINFAESTQANTELLTSNLNAGDYVVEFNEFEYWNSSDKPAVNNLVSQKTDQTLQGELTKGVEPVFQATSSCVATPHNVTGKVTFDRVPHAGTSLNYAGTFADDAQEIVVEVICAGGVYSDGVTSSTGAFTLAFPESMTSFVRARAQMKSTIPAYDFSVVDNTSGQATYVMDSPSFFESADFTLPSIMHAASGWTGTEYTNPRVAAPFAILDSIRLAKDDVVNAGVTSFPTLRINWSVNNTTARGDLTLGQIGTSFFNGSEIYLLGAADNDTDEYDGHVIIHEWGHYFEHSFSRADSIGGPHSSSDILDMRVAFSEGFGNAFSGMVTGNPLYIDVSGDDQGIGFSINVENNSCTNAGWFSECSVQSTLYDLYDNTAELNDSVDLSFNEILAVLMNEQKTTPAFTSIFSFIKPLKDNHGASANAIDALTSAQNIDPILDIYGDSETTNNPGVTNQLPVHAAF